MRRDATSQVCLDRRAMDNAPVPRRPPPPRAANVSSWSLLVTYSAVSNVVRLNNTVGQGAVDSSGAAVTRSRLGTRRAARSSTPDELLALAIGCANNFIGLLSADFPHLPGSALKLPVGKKKRIRAENVEDPRLRRIMNSWGYYVVVGPIFGILCVQLDWYCKWKLAALQRKLQTAICWPLETTFGLWIFGFYLATMLWIAFETFHLTHAALLHSRRHDLCSFLPGLLWKPASYDVCRSVGIY